MRILHNEQLTNNHEPLRAPAWFRYGVVALATLVMCSCTAARPEYRVAQTERANVRGQSPSTISIVGPTAASQRPAIQLVSAAEVVDEPVIAEIDLVNLEEIKLATAEVPTHVTPEQIAADTPLPPGFKPAACAHTGCACCNHDAIRGPNDEYLCDGGDFGLPVGVRADWTIEGLEQEDTIAHYDTVDGRTIVTPSNKLCIYAPRFAVVRQVTDLRAYAQYNAADGALQRVGPVRIDELEEAATSLAEVEPIIHRENEPSSLLRERQQSGELDRDRRVAATIGRLAPYANHEVVRTGTLTGVDIPRIARASLAAITWSGDQAAQVVFDVRKAHAEVSVQTPGTIYHLFEPNNPKLRLIKLASKGAAAPGEEVEFTLRFDNVGDRVIGNVTIADNLTTRLEYVPDSQKSSLTANFSTEVNEGDSLVLRWEILDPVQPGDGGVLQFRARVR